MNTVTIVAYNRPTYTMESIRALAETICHYGKNFFDLLIFSIDPGNRDVFTLCEAAGKILAEEGIIDCKIYRNVQKFGVAGNPQIALQRAFEEHGSDFNLAIEDDASLKPDAVRLAAWFKENYGGPLSEYMLMAMCNHNPGGLTDPRLVNNPAIISEATFITSPFAWCCSKHQWPFFKYVWNKKQKPPNGWDWSMSYHMRLCHKLTLHPMLSRCQNIGREGGANETPETFDKTQLNIVYSDGSYDGE